MIAGSTAAIFVRASNRVSKIARENCVATLTAIRKEQVTIRKSRFTIAYSIQYHKIRKTQFVVPLP